MIIGDWEVTVTKQSEFNPKPGDDKSIPQKINTYLFLHIPTGVVVSRTIQFIEPHDDASVLEVLTSESARLLSLTIR